MVMQGGVAATEPLRPIPNIGTSVSFTGTSRYKTVWDETVTTVVSNRSTLREKDMTRIVPVPCRETMEGVFFEFLVLHNIDDILLFHASPTGILGYDRNAQSNVSDYIWFEEIKGEYKLRRAWYECPVNRRHCTRRQLAGLEVDVCGGPLVRHLLPLGPLDEFVMVSEEMAVLLQQLAPRKMALERAKINVNQSEVRNVRVWGWQFLGRARIWPHRIEGGSNACPFCGAPNVFCEGCTDAKMQCPQCEKPGIFVHENEWGGAGDKRIVYGDSVSSMLDGQWWDGSDLLQVFSMYAYRRYASRRFITWLLRMGAGLFLARPVMLCLDGMSETQRRWLRELEKPLEPGVCQPAPRRLRR